MNNDNNQSMETPLEHIHIAAGERIFTQGEVGDTAYVIVDGVVSLHQQHEGHRTDLGHIRTGEIFGEMAVLDGSRRSVTAIAVQDCVLAPVPQALFHQRLDRADPFINALIRLFIHNIRSSPKLFLRRPRSFRDHLRQISALTWNMRRFSGRLRDTDTANDVQTILDRLDKVLIDLSAAAEIIADKRQDMIADEELSGVGFGAVVGTEGRRKL